MGKISGGSAGGVDHDLLSLTHPDTTPASPVVGDLISGTVGPVWSRLPIGGAAEVLTVAGGVPTWAAIPNSHVAATVSGNGIDIAGQDIHLHIGTGATDISAGNHAHAGVYEPVDATLVRTGDVNWIDLTDSGQTALHTHAAAAPAAHDQNASTIIIPNGLGSPTYDDLQDFINLTRSAGRLTGGVVSKGTGATISITPMDGMIFTGTTLGTSPLIYFKMPQQTDILAPGGPAGCLTDGAVNWIYIDYASGTPVYKATTNRATLNDYTMFTVGRAWVLGTDLEVQLSGHSLYNKDRRAHNRLILKYSGMDYVSGATVSALTVGGAAGQGVETDAGSWYIANTPYTTAAKAVFKVWYRTGGVWTESASLDTFDDAFGGAGVTVFTRYQNGADLGTLSGSGKYGVYWIFMCPEGGIYVVLGTGNYGNIGSAQAAKVPSVLPPYLVNWGRLIGRVICQKSSATHYSVESTWATQFTLSATTDHTSLANLDTASYTHLTAANYTDLTDAGATTLHKHDHGGMDGLSDDDHTQYVLKTEGISRIATQTLASDAASVTFSAIPGTYRDLLLFVSGECSDAVGKYDNIKVQYNDDTGTNYATQYLASYVLTTTSGELLDQADSLVGQLSTSVDVTLRSGFTLTIPDYANATKHKCHWSSGVVIYDTVTVTSCITFLSLAGQWDNINAITKIKLFPNVSANFKAGSKFSLYGVS